MPPQWVRGGVRGGARLSPPDCLSDPLLGRHGYAKIRVGSALQRGGHLAQPFLCMKV